MLTIGKLAAAVNISTDTLRYYEREGLLVPSSRSEAGYRLYEPNAVRRIRFIRHAQRCGFTLAEIQDLLHLRSQTDACCSDVRQRAIEKKLQLEAKIREMQAMSSALDHLIADCVDGRRPVGDCPILAALEQVGQELVR